MEVYEGLAMPECEEAAPTEKDAVSWKDPKEAVLDWRVTAVGHRPQDYLVRDLLHTSLWRDDRPTWFHESCKHPPDWVVASVRHLPNRDQTAAIAHTVLHWLHKQNLVRRLNEANRAGVLGWDADAAALLRKLWACWPYGVSVTWVGDGRKSRRDICDRARACPWCHARRALQVYKRLTRGALWPSETTNLVMGRVEINSGKIGQAVGLRKLLAGGDRSWAFQAEPSYFAPTVPDASGNTASFYSPHNPNRILHAEHVDLVRRDVGSWLVAEARRIGIRDGMLVYQVGPHLDGELRVFRHELIFLGAIDLPGEEEEWRFDEAMSSSGQRVCSISTAGVIPGFADRQATKKLARIHWLRMSSANPVCFRVVVAGSSPGYDLGKLGLRAFESDMSHLERKGVSGAFALQPTFMFDDVQWWSYVQGTRGKQLYTPFGAWKRHQGKERTYTRGRRISIVPRTRRARTTELSEGKTENHKPVGKRQQRHAWLLEEARKLWAGLRLQSEGKRGRPTLRTPLRERLAAHGIIVSNKEIKRLVAALNHEGLPSLASSTQDLEGAAVEAEETQQIDT